MISLAEAAIGLGPNKYIPDPCGARLIFESDVC